MKNRLLKLLLVVLILVSFTALAMSPAYGINFSHSFTSTNKIGTTYIYSATVSHGGYVDPTYAYAPTDYVVQLSSTGTSINLLEDSLATDPINGKTSSSRDYWTYRTNGGIVQRKYYMVYNPTGLSFDPYTISGTWIP